MRQLPIKAGLAVLLVFGLAACEHHVQTTSGSQYLAAYNAGAGKTPDATSSALAAIDAEILAAAAVEPQLRFPARLGLARIDNGRLTAIPAAEGKAWHSLAERLGSGYGAMLPVSPLIAALATPATIEDVDYGSRLAEVVREIRLGAARQHLDAVLIYETFGTSEATDNALAITKLAIIGFFLPTEDVEAEGFAQAVLVDVRNGYTYGTAMATAAEPVFQMATSGNRYDAELDARDEARVLAVEALTGEVETMMRELRLALAERQTQGAVR